MNNRIVKITMQCILLSAVCLAVLMASGCAQRSVAMTADHMVNAIIKGDFVTATKDYSPVMMAVMSPDRLRRNWVQITEKSGPLKSRSDWRQVKDGRYQAVYVTCEFEKATWCIRTIINTDNKIDGVWFLPPEPSAGQYKVPKYVYKERFVELNVKIGHGVQELPATLAVPTGKGPFPIVVMTSIADRDGAYGPVKPFRDLAWGMASQGISVLRYDGRSYHWRGKKNHPKLRPDWTVKDEATDDMLAAIAYARSLKTVDKKRIYILGHGMCGFLMPRIGKVDPQLAGLIVMSGYTRPLEDVMFERDLYMVSLDEPVISAYTKKQINAERRDLIRIKSLKPNSRGSAPIWGMPESYWRDLHGYHPAQVAKSLKQPMLIMQGRRAFQSTTADFDSWKQNVGSRPNVTLKLYPDLNHIFMTGTGRSTAIEYGIPGNVSQQVVSDICGWIHGQK